ncbi:MAG: hypothetical protein F2915_03605, partial [Actinobacteria bacterium]|nr:hypothetical protein [Actinomycetota bacterium]
MAEEDKGEIQETSKLPSSRLARTAKFGSLVGGQSAKWAATSAINRLRTEERADEA